MTKQSKKTTTIRLNEALIEKLKQAAKEDGRSLNNFIEQTLKKEVK